MYVFIDMTEGLYNPLCDPLKQIELCECCLMGILGMMHSFWWLLSKLLVTVGRSPWLDVALRAAVAVGIHVGMVDLSLQQCPACLSHEVPSAVGQCLEPTCRQ